MVWNVWPVLLKSSEDLLRQINSWCNVADKKFIHTFKRKLEMTDKGLILFSFFFWFLQRNKNL